MNPTTTLETPTPSEDLSLRKVPYRGDQLTWARQMSLMASVPVLRTQACVVAPRSSITDDEVAFRANVLQIAGRVLAQISYTHPYGWPNGRHSEGAFMRDPDLRIGWFAGSFILCVSRINELNATGVTRRISAPEPRLDTLEPAGLTVMLRQEIPLIVTEAPLFPLTSATLALSVQRRKRKIRLQISLTADARTCRLGDPEQFLAAYLEALV